MNELTVNLTDCDSNSWLSVVQNGVAIQPVITGDSFTIEIDPVEGWNMVTVQTNKPVDGCFITGATLSGDSDEVVTLAPGGANLQVSWVHTVEEENSIPWTPLEPSTPVEQEEIPWTPLEPATPVEDEGVPWTELEPAEPVSGEDEEGAVGEEEPVVVEGKQKELETETTTEDTLATTTSTREPQPELLAETGFDFTGLTLGAMALVAVGAVLLKKTLRKVG